MVQFYAAISHLLSAEDPESAFDVSVRWISPHRQKLIDRCVDDLADAWSAVRVVEVEGEARVQAGEDGEFSTYYVVQAVDVL